MIDETHSTTARDQGAAKRAHSSRTPLLLTVQQAAEMLAIGRSTAYELIADGELEVVHIRRAVRVPMAAVEDYVTRLRRRAS